MARESYRISLNVMPRYARYVRSRSIAALVRRTLAAERAAVPVALSIVIADDTTLRQLNRRYRGQNTPTDVLSFDLATDDRFVLPSGVRAHELGEIVISYPTASRQARAAGHSTQEELAHLLVHGVLHLLGYDHKRPRDEKAMRAREDMLLGRRAHLGG